MGSLMNNLEPNLDSRPGVTDLQIRRNMRYGLLFFFIYTAIYGTFMLLNTFAPWLMEREIVGGLNLAVCYGLGLIVAAFVLALIYAWICRAPATIRGNAR